MNQVSHAPTRIGASRFLLALLLALSPFAATASADALTVDDDGPADFVLLQDAVDAAVEGDLILVRPGSYGFTVVDGKSLTLQVDGPPGSVIVRSAIFTPLFSPALEVRNLAPDQSVVVRGFDLTNFGLDSHEYVAGVASSLGAVIFEECTLMSTTGDAVRVSESASVTFVRTTIDAGTSYYDAFQPAYLKRDGLTADDSTVYLYDCVVRGSFGPDGMPTFFGYYLPGNGGIAARITGTTMFASGCSFEGGHGGSGTSLQCDEGYDGGHGIVHVQSLVRLLDTTVVGGTAGVATPGCGLPDGDPGDAFFGDPSEVHPLPGAARSFALASPLDSGASIQMSFAGEPGDAVIVVVGLQPGVGLWHPAFSAVQLVAAPILPLSFGALPATGSLDLTFPVPALAAGADFARYPAQALFVTAAAEVFHSGPSTVVLVDPSL